MAAKRKSKDTPKRPKNHYSGETGNRMIQAIKLAQAMSPRILLIDEIDKAFGSGQGGEHEESRKRIWEIKRKMKLKAKEE